MAHVRSYTKEMKGGLFLPRLGSSIGLEHWAHMTHMMVYDLFVFMGMCKCVYSHAPKAGHVRNWLYE